MREPTIAGLINARLLSTRLPRKLLLPFADRTLIDIALEKLARMDFFAHRYFGVAEDELAGRLTGHQGIELLIRDPQAVLPGYNDKQKISEHCRRIEADYIFWLNPCAPLLSIDTIRSACDQVLATRYNSYTSVVETRDWIFDQEGLPVTNVDPAMISTAHSKKFFRVAHSFHVMNKEFFLKSFVPWTFTKHDPELIQIPEEETFDVNTPVEFEVAQAAYLRARAFGKVG
jgi:CMP-N-acetylneuraminic acid synthetase